MYFAGSEARLRNEWKYEWSRRDHEYFYFLFSSYLVVCSGLQFLLRPAAWPEMAIAISSCKRPRSGQLLFLNVLFAMRGRRGQSHSLTTTVGTGGWATT